MSATSADWSGIDGFGSTAPTVATRSRRRCRRSSRSRLSSAAEIGLPASSSGGGGAEERRSPVSVANSPAGLPREQLRVAPGRADEVGRGRQPLEGCRIRLDPVERVAIREIAACLRDELLGEQDRVVLQLGVGAEAALEILCRPGTEPM